MQAAFTDNWTSATARCFTAVGTFRCSGRSGIRPHSFHERSRFRRREHSADLPSFRSPLRDERCAFPWRTSFPTSWPYAISLLPEPGVRVQLILPGEHMDRGFVRRASRSRWGPLLRAGVEIYEYQPTMYHCKVMIVDELWTSVGSTNFDSRSFISTTRQTSTSSTRRSQMRSRRNSRETLKSRSESSWISGKGDH